MRREECVPVPRGWTGKAAWKGAGASLLLHLFVGAALVVALSGPPRPAPRVVDLTLLTPAGSDRPPVQRVLSAAKPARDRGKDVLPEPPAPPAAPAVAEPPGAAAPAGPSDPGAGPTVSVPSLPPAAASSTTGAAGRDPVIAAAGSPPGKPGERSLAADFAWIREAIQGAIAYPATARRMGWEGEVVVSFHLLSDGSVRDVRVVQGSGHAALDRGAVDAVRNASPFPRSAVEAEIITPVVYRLTAR